mgnify:CR=1 FL=1
MGFTVRPLPCKGWVVISLISASTSSGVISSGESLPFWDISARVLVRSTIVSRPSVEERRRRVRDGVSDLGLGAVPWTG